MTDDELDRYEIQLLMVNSGSTAIEFVRTDFLVTGASELDKLLSEIYAELERRSGVTA